MLRVVTVVNPGRNRDVDGTMRCDARQPDRGRSGFQAIAFKETSMIRRTLIAAAVAASALAGAAFAPAASAHTAWSVSVGAPGFAASAGDPYVAAPAYPAYRPYWHHHHHYYRYYAPPVVYAPAPVYVPPRVVYRPAYVAPAPAYESPYYPPY
jgi:hypothetical protein